VSNTTQMCEELLPFTVGIVRNQEDLDKAVQIRHSAYARHLPEFAESLRSPEAADTDQGTVVLLAKSKLDGSPLGTMRIQTNEFKPLCLEQSITLPRWLSKLRLAEATRLGVADGTGGRLVTNVLFKSFFQFCQQAGTEWMVVTGRSPVDRQYVRLLFTDVFPGMGYTPIRHVGNVPHRVMQFNVPAAEMNWSAVNHPLFDFIFRTHHPDIEIGSLPNVRTLSDRRIASSHLRDSERRCCPERRAPRHHWGFHNRVSKIFSN
jgi:hypothetical protein